MTEQEYNALPGVRRSDLWKISESPEKYKYAVEHPSDESTPAFVFGAAAHKLILEGAKAFAEEYAVCPAIDKRTNAGKEQWKTFCIENEGKTVISQDDFDKICAMETALSNCPAAFNIIRMEGETESPYQWTDNDTGEPCKVKLDRLVELDGRYVVVDYKTAKSAATDQFIHSMIKYGYHLQAAMYTEAVMVEKKLDYRPDFLFVVQEKDEPFSVNMILVTSDSGVMTYGVDTFRELIGTLHQCNETGYWYGYLGAFSEVNEAYLPGYISLGDEE